jgi:pimeloyl-ACP methyl ester carboxylesterase
MSHRSSERPADAGKQVLMMDSENIQVRERPMVLVHGAMHGGWCWRRMLTPLRAAGFEVHAPTLTGLSDRAHLLTKDVDLDLHIADVIALIEAEELTGVELVGHSYGCLVVTGVAAAIPERIARVVLVDGPIAVDGDSGASSHPIGHTFIERSQVVNGVGVVPPTDGSSLGLDEADLAWVRRRLTAQPLNCVIQPIKLAPDWGDEVEKVFIRCVRSDNDVPAPYVARAGAGSGWTYREIRSGHDVMISRPIELTELLLEVCDPGGPL